MYSFVSGTLVEKTLTLAVVEVNGMGLELAVSLSTSQKLPAAGERVRLFTHFVVREDAHLLFGFLTEEERSIFKLLLSVNGVGPKMAMTILSGIRLEELKRAIVQGSVSVLTAVSGIGRKTAERLIIELREKIIIDQGESNKVPVPLGTHEALVQDSLQALMALGYSRQNAKAAIQKVLDHDREASWNVESLIRASLKYM